MNKLKVILVLVIYSFIFGSYLFYKGHKKGYVDGWEGYKYSINMQYALSSACKFCYYDGINDCKNGLTK